MREGSGNGGRKGWEEGIEVGLGLIERRQEKERREFFSPSIIYLFILVDGKERD